MMFKRKKQSTNQSLSLGYTIFLVLFLFALLGLKLWQYHWPEVTIYIHNSPIDVLVAKTPLHQKKGLGGRESLEQADGMMFIFPELARHGIVMRDMHFPIDIVWVDNGVIVDIAPHVPIEPGIPEAQLHVYRPRAPANVVLEFPAGWVEDKGVVIGDTVRAQPEG